MDQPLFTRAILVIAKNEHDKSTAHFLALTQDDGEAIKMVKTELTKSNSQNELQSMEGIVSETQFASYGGYSQFTVKPVFSSLKVPDNKLFIL